MPHANFIVDILLLIKLTVAANLTGSEVRPYDPFGVSVLPFTRPGSCVDLSAASH